MLAVPQVAGAVPPSDRGGTIPAMVLTALGRLDQELSPLVRELELLEPEPEKLWPPPARGQAEAGDASRAARNRAR